MRRLPVSVIACLFASGCATSYAPADGAVDEARYAADVEACEEAASQANPLDGTMLAFLGGAAWGAMRGAIAGAAAGNIAEGAVIGTNAGAVLGTVVGTVTGNQDEQRLIGARMQGKGFRPA
jgi:hypothetical protein